MDRFQFKNEPDKRKDNELKKLRKYYRRLENQDLGNSGRDECEYSDYEKSRLEKALINFLNKEGYCIYLDKAPKSDEIKRMNSKTIQIFKFSFILIVSAIFFFILFTTFSKPEIMILWILLIPVIILNCIEKVKTYVYPNIVQIDGAIGRTETFAGKGRYVSYSIDGILINTLYFEFPDSYWENENTEYMTKGVLVVEGWNSFEIKKSDLLYYPMEIEELKD